MPTRWVFEERKKKDKKRDPMEAEFFTGHHDEEDVAGRTDSLVREAIQNSLDARRPDSRVVMVRFAIGTGPVSADHTRTYLDGLIEHLKALGNDTVNGRVPPMSHLVVEDFGTRGLCGDPGQYEDPPVLTASSHDFYWFWRNVGRSGKGGGDRGRWGVGKTVFPACSTINAMYGLTVQSDTSRRLLMGQAVLKTHRIGVKEFSPDGWFCDPAKSEDLQMPFEDASFLDATERNFGLRRGSEPGTSIIIPYPIETLKASSILQSVVVHYFMQIVRGLLVVEVEGPELSRTVLDAGNIEAAASGMTWSGKRGEKKHVAPPIALARFAHHCSQSGKATVAARQDNAPVWTAALFEPADLASIRDSFEAGDPLAIRVPVDVVFNEKHFQEVVRPTRPDAVRQRPSWFDVFLQRSRDAATPRGEDYFIRGGMTISGISTIPQARGVTALVLVDEDGLTSFLGDAENPSHTDWREGEDALKKKYDKYHSRIRFVRNSVEKLLGLLALAKKGLDKRALVDFFPFEVPNSSRTGRRTKAKIPKIPPPRPKAFEVRPIRGGFVIAGRPSAGVPVPRKLHVRAAYELDKAAGRGSFRHYDPRDFAFDGRVLTISTQGCELGLSRGNELELVEIDPEFELTVTGFSETLDLVVQAVDPDARRRAPVDEEADESTAPTPEGGRP